MQRQNHRASFLNLFIYHDSENKRLYFPNYALKGLIKNVEVKDQLKNFFYSLFSFFYRNRLEIKSLKKLHSIEITKHGFLDLNLKLQHDN